MRWRQPSLQHAAQWAVTAASHRWVGGGHTGRGACSPTGDSPPPALPRSLSTHLSCRRALSAFAARGDEQIGITYYFVTSPSRAASRELLSPRPHTVSPCFSRINACPAATPSIPQDEDRRCEGTSHFRRRGVGGPGDQVWGYSQGWHQLKHQPLGGRSVARVLRLFTAAETWCDQQSLVWVGLKTQ